MEFGDDDLSNFNAEKNKLIKERNITKDTKQKEEGSKAEAALLTSRHDTQAEDADEQFM